MLEGAEGHALELANGLGQPHVAYACSKYAIAHYARRLAPTWASRASA